MILNVPWSDSGDVTEFPDVHQAMKDPDGLLMMGGNLSPSTLKRAYTHGIFPWFEKGQPIMWWCPSVRAIIPTMTVHVSKNMYKLIRQGKYQVRVDSNFNKVIAACGSRDQTWITETMLQAYSQLHQDNVAHSVEVYRDEQLVGGLYGVFIKNCFCGESMFSFEANTSKLALIHLSWFLNALGCEWIDCQLPTRHLTSMGAIEMSREKFVSKLHVMRDNHRLINQTWVSLWQRR